LAEKRDFHNLLLDSMPFGYSEPWEGLGSGTEGMALDSGRMLAHCPGEKQGYSES
jgi:hypothetical protein